MKANELRIGNWVLNYKDIPTQILEWTGNEAYLTEGRRAYGIKTSNSIPLTEEWLVKFGFYKIPDRSYEIQAKYFDLQVYIPGKYFGVVAGRDEIALNYNLEYVHQLQNLYFALTGEELTIKQ